MIDEADDGLVKALRAGDEEAFAGLVRRHHRALVRVACCYVPSEAVAEEVAQETWLAVVRGIDRFEGRSSLKTWIFAVLVNQARSRGERERRSVPVSSLGGTGEDSGPTVPAERFLGPGDPFDGYWVTPPCRYGDLPEERLTSAETLAVVGAAIRELPERQRRVIALRDVEGWTADEVCALFSLSEANQRVLLHRARARVRLVLEAHFLLSETP